MTDDEKRALREAAQVLLTLLTSVAIKRAIKVSENERLTLIRHYDWCLMDEIVISWCKLFGSKRTEKIHFQNLPVIDSTALQSDLDSACGAVGLAGISKRIRKYRDTYVAHHDLDQSKRATQHPKLDPLRDTGEILYREVYDKLSAVGNANGLPDPDGITGTERDKIGKHWESIARKARDAVKMCKDCP